MRASLIAVAAVLMAGPAAAQTTNPPATAPTPSPSSPATDPSAKSYVNPQETEAPKNDDNQNPNYQTPAGSKATGGGQAPADSPAARGGERSRSNDEKPQDRR